MTTNEFVTKYLGKKIDFDGQVEGQCVDLFRQYVKEVLLYPQPKGVVGAKDFWTNYPTDPNLNQYYDRIPNDPTAVPKNGDVMLWDKTAGDGFGHVSVFIEGNVNTFTSFDQNWPTLSKCTKTQHTYTNPKVLGWLRPKGEPMANCLLPDTEENRKKWGELVGKSSSYDEFVSAGYKKVEDVTQRISNLENDLRGKDETLKSLNQTISNKNDQMSILQSQLSSKEQSLLDATMRVESLTEQAKKIPDLEKENVYLNEQRSIWIESEKSYNRSIGQLKAENAKLRSGALSELIRVAITETLNKIKAKFGGTKKG